MAYGNWGAFVYKNGERQKNHEDATPYRETELAPGYHQAFMRSEGLDPHHAVLGSGKVRLCGYKNYPVLLVGGESVDLGEYKTAEDDYDSEYSGEVEGHKFSASQYNGNMVDLHLTEPDGTQWTSTCGYEHGAGHMD